MFKRLPLNSIKNVRNTLSGLIRTLYREGETDERSLAWWRTITNMISELIKAHKIEKELDIEVRLEAIEKALRERGFTI